MKTYLGICGRCDSAEEFVSSRPAKAGFNPKQTKGRGGEICLAQAIVAAKGQRVETALISAI